MYSPRVSLNVGSGTSPLDRPVHIFVDAAGKDAHLGAVLFCDGAWMWTHMDPPAVALDSFLNSRKNQIMGLELLAVSLGLSTFSSWIKGRRVVVHCDNTGAEVCTLSCVAPGFIAVAASQASVRRGSSRTWDHAQLVHAQWLHAAALGVHLHIKRVGTTDNIADLPSRKVRSL